MKFGIGRNILDWGKRFPKLGSCTHVPVWVITIAAAHPVGHRSQIFAHISQDYQRLKSSLIQWIKLLSPAPLLAYLCNDWLREYFSHMRSHSALAKLLLCILMLSSAYLVCIAHTSCTSGTALTDRFLLNGGTIPLLTRLVLVSVTVRVGGSICIFDAV